MRAIASTLAEILHVRRRRGFLRVHGIDRHTLPAQKIFVQAPAHAPRGLRATRPGNEKPKIRPGILLRIFQVAEDVRLHDGNFRQQRQGLAQDVPCVRMTRDMGMDGVGGAFLQCIRDLLRRGFDRTDGHAACREFRAARSVGERQHNDVMFAFVQAPSPPARGLLRAAEGERVEKNGYFHRPIAPLASKLTAPHADSGFFART